MKITRYILALTLALCATGAQAQAISALPAASTLGGTEVTAVVQSATTKKATIDVTGTDQIGVAVRAKTSSDTTVRVRLDGIGL